MTDYTTTKCPECGLSFHILASRKGNRRYCTIECSLAARSKAQTARHAARREHRGLDHKGVMRDCIQEVHFCWGAEDGFARERAFMEGQ